MKRLNIKYTSLLLLAILFVACSSGTQNKTKLRTDTPTSGVARIVVDECLAPIIQQQVDVFEGTYPEATIIPIYTGEKEAYEILKDDSVRVLIGTRNLTDAERQKITERRQRIMSQRLAVDGVALIINNKNMDTLITVEEIRKIMVGEIRDWKELDLESKLGEITVVFDRPNSSTAKFISDSITNKVPFGAHVRAIGDDSDRTDELYSSLTPNQLVVDYVEKNPNALGIVGVNWVSNPADSTRLSFSSRINVMSVSSGVDVAGRPLYYKPYPAFLGMKFYPLSRDVYIIITESRGGLPSGFVSFAAGEKGQRIIFKSGLFPATIPTRMVSVKSSFDE